MYLHIINLNHYHCATLTIYSLCLVYCNMILSQQRINYRELFRFGIKLNLIYCIKQVVRSSKIDLEPTMGNHCSTLLYSIDYTLCRFKRGE